MNQKTKMRYTSEKGITLIALVITIIVLLILAGVTINMVLGDDGIIKQAQAAKQAQEVAAETEAEEISITQAQLSDYAEGKSASEVNSKLGTTNATEGVIADIKEFNDGYVPIPKGFAYLEGNSVNEGVVVIDKNGNEFVWVPVDGVNVKVQQIDDGDQIEPTSGGLDTGIVPEGTIESEYAKMKESVATYGGFYVGRYETSYDAKTKKVASVKGATPKQANWYVFYKDQIALYEGSSSVVSGMIYGGQWDAIMAWMKDVPNTIYPDQKYINNAIGMGNFGTDCEKCEDYGTCLACEGTGEILCTKCNSTGESEYPGVIELCTTNPNCEGGYDWERDDLCQDCIICTDCDFYNNPGIVKCKNCKNGKCNNCIGGIKGEVTLTGSNPAFAVKNIYDMAGNCSEWTQLAVGDVDSNYFLGRIIKGSHYGCVEGEWCMPANLDYDLREPDEVDSYTSRLQLYIK